MTTRNFKALLAVLPASLALTVPALAGHPTNAIERHPTLTGAAAALATHHALKVAARNAKLHHKKLNFAERHPTLSAIGAGVVTRHEIKKHTPQ